jgi:hypothetical protein
MSEIITTRSLGYSIDQGADETDYIARLINPSAKRADLAFFDPGTGVISLYTNDGDDVVQFDSGYPTDDFIVAMRNHREENGLPVYQVVVEELGIDVAAGNLNLESPGRPLHKMEVFVLEESPIVGFSPAGYNAESGRYLYTVNLENGHTFELSARTSFRSSSMMNDTKYDRNKVYIDDVGYDFFARHKSVEKLPYGEEYSEKISKRMEFLIKIYFDRNINITLENQG